MKCPFDGCPWKSTRPVWEANDLSNHLYAHHEAISLSWKLAEMIAAESETIPKSKIRAKIKELEVIEKPLRYQSDFHEDYRVKGMIEVLKQLLE